MVCSAPGSACPERQPPREAQALISPRRCVRASGKRLVDDRRLKAGLAGAALLERNLQEALALEGDGKEARPRSSGADVAPELVPLLARADGYAPRKAVARIGGAESFKDRAGDLRDATWNRLESSALVRSQEHKVMGLFPTTRCSSPPQGRRASRPSGVLSTARPSPTRVRRVWSRLSRQPGYCPRWCLRWARGR